MIAAVYARKSTDQNIPDAEKSVTRQVEHATAYAARKGWTVDPAHVYQDDGISGAEFVKRPGLLRLMNTLKPRPPFAVLVMSEESRLGREQIETAYLLKQLITAGVRVAYYLEDRERTTRRPTRSCWPSAASPMRSSATRRGSGPTMRCAGRPARAT
jgi:DNA invertase Pin-like site-specific DNA recombinase